MTSMTSMTSGVLGQFRRDLASRVIGRRHAMTSMTSGVRGQWTQGHFRNDHLSRITKRGHTGRIRDGLFIMRRRNHGRSERDAACQQLRRLCWCCIGKHIKDAVKSFGGETVFARTVGWQSLEATARHGAERRKPAIWRVPRIYTAHLQPLYSVKTVY